MTLLPQAIAVLKRVEPYADRLPLSVSAALKAVLAMWEEQQKDKGNDKAK